MTSVKRAISDEEKKQRIEDIIFTAEKLLICSEYKDITMAKIAKDTGIAKGTIFIYFPSKEELFLRIAQRTIIDWSHTFQKDMQRIVVEGRSCCVEEFVDLIVNSMKNAILVKLFSILDDTLEQNISLERAIEFKTSLKNEMCNMGKLIEIIMPCIQSGQGMLLLNHMFVCLVGAYKEANASSVVQQAILTPGLEVFHRDFYQTIKVMSVYLIYGYMEVNKK